MSNEKNHNVYNFKRALLGKVDIYDTEDGKYKKISEIPDYCEQMDFIYADFDDDGINEVVVRFPMEASVFHKVDEVVYRYPMSLYTMPLKAKCIKYMNMMASR